MKRKPDMMMALILMFCMGLAFSGLASINGHKEKSGYEVAAQVLGQQ